MGFIRISQVVLLVAGGGVRTPELPASAAPADSHKKFGHDLLLKVLMCNMHEIWSFD